MCYEQQIALHLSKGNHLKSYNMPYSVPLKQKNAAFV